MRARNGAGTAAATILLLALHSAGAEAHHVMGGKMPATFMDGFLSGLGHPILGADHFAFVVGIGLLAGIGGLGLLLPAIFVVAMMGGLALHIAGFDLPFAEVLLAASVLALGLAVAARNEGGMPWSVSSLFALAGIFHGYAFAETIVGAQSTPLFAYILGLAVVQMAIAGLAWRLASSSSGARSALNPWAVRALGLTIAVVGAVFLALNNGLVS